MKNVKKLWSLILTVCIVLSVVTQALMPVIAYADSGNTASTTMIISTVAGTNNSDFSGDNGPAVSAGVSPRGVAVDGSGNLYIADYGNNRVRRVDHSTGYISTVAGNGGFGFSGDDGSAVNAELKYPRGVAVDNSGNLYIADSGNNRIRRVDHSTGYISTVAGTGTAGFIGDGGPGTDARLNHPEGVAVDGGGNLYIAESSNNSIRRVDHSTGYISTVAGNGGFGFSGDDGPAVSAQLNHPYGVAVDGSGNLYIADGGNNRIRMVDHLTGKISTVVGTGTQGFSGDDGSATSAQLHSPDGVAVDGSGNLYIADTGNNRIRMVDNSAGDISTLAGNGINGFSGDYGPATSAQMKYPNGVAVDGSGNLYVSEWENARVRKVEPASYSMASISNQTMTDIAAQYTSGTQETRRITVSSIGSGCLENLSASLGGGAGSSFEITQPAATTLNLGTPTTTFTVKAKDGLAVGTYTDTVTVSADPVADIIFTVTQVVIVSPPVISTVAGSGNYGFSGDNGPAASAKMNGPNVGVAVDGSGNLYFTDAGNQRIRKVDHLTGNISTVAGNGTYGFSGDNGPAVSAQLNDPRGVAVDGSGNLYIADTYNHRIRKVDHLTGNISTVAGTGTQGFGGDNGAAASAQLNYPNGVAVDGRGDLYIADTYNSRLRRVDHITGNISTIAGDGNYGSGGDNGPATNAQLNWPRGIAVDGSGNLYIADTNNDRIRRVDHSTGKISTVAGVGYPAFGGYYGPATSARLDKPYGVAVDGSGNLYIADYNNSCIHRVNSSGWISTMAGTGTGGFSGDNGPAASAQLYYPNGVAVDGSGNLYIADYGNNRIRRIAPASYTIAHISDQTMMAMTEGYASGTQETKSITVTRTGTGVLQNLAVAFSGGAGGSFEITQPLAAALNTGTPSTSFTVKAKDGLAVGTYTETVTVSADSMDNVTFTVTQVVNELLPPGAAPAIQSAVAGNAHVNITWTGVTGATGYKIFKSTTPGSYSSDCNTANGAVYSYDVTELTNGVTYYFVVKAINDGDDSPGSAEVSATPKTVPGAPTNVTAIAGNGQATISFTAPVDNGGSAITGYTVTSNPGNITAAGTGNLITLTGLTNKTTYTFTVTATNVVGTGAASAPSNAVEPNNLAIPTNTITIGTQPAALTNATESSISGNLTVAAVVSPSGTPAYEWFSCDDTSRTNPVTTGITANTFTIPTTLTAGNYYYYCEVRATGGATPVNSHVATVAVNPASSGIYTISFDANGGTGTAPTESNKAAGAIFTAAAANSFTPPAGKQFKEWNTAANGSGTSYLAGATVTMPVNNLTLYAIWEPVPAVTSITVAPPTVSVQKGNTQTYTATVNGTNSPAQTVTWSVYGNTSGSTSIDASGLLTVAADETAATLTVTATSVADNTKSGTATVTVTATPPAFVPVTSITGVPTAATAGVNLTLSGTVAPANATNQTVVWSVYSTGTTGATISGNTLSATTAGTVTVRATITNGLTASTNYTQDFNITVNAAAVTTYAITFNSNGAVYTTKTVNAGENIGSAAWPTDPIRSSYTFGGWFTGENGAGTQFTSMTPVNAATTIYAKWTYSGSGGGFSSGGGNTTPATSTYNAEVNAGNGSNVKLPVTVDKSSGKASVDVGTGNSLMSDGKTTVVTVPAVPDVDTYTLGIPVPSLSTQDEQGTLVFSTDTGTVTVRSNMLTGVSGISGSKAEISIGQGDKTSLPSDVKTAIGDKPLISLSLSIDGKQTDWSNPNAPVTVSIPYTPTAAELANPESIVIWYIDGSGNAVSIPNGHYDPATGSVTFTTTHFSYYAVGYNKVSFSDVAISAWYNKAVGFIAARGITTGTGNGNYSPEAKLTRGEFLVMMMRAYGIAPDASPKDNFTDAGRTYYTGYLAAAKRLGISTGVGDNLFAPEKEITRQEMFTLLYNALRSMDELPADKAAKDLSAFEDASKIASWAKDAMTLFVKTGTVSGGEGMLTPTSTTTRAEMAQVLYNLLSK